LKVILTDRTVVAAADRAVDQVRVGEAELRLLIEGERGAAIVGRRWLQARLFDGARYERFGNPGRVNPSVTR
jgi:hypothetical protein